MRWTVLGLLLLSGLGFPGNSARADGDPRKLSFEKDVQPLLAQHCFRCHDARKKTADFRLDVRQLALAGGESKAPGIVRGRPAESEIIKRIETDDEDLQMPPGGTKLPAAAIQTLKQWIAQGADWPDALANESTGPKHWAFQPPVRPTLPKVPEVAGRPPAEHPIDRFIRAKLTEKGLQPSPPADATTLLRRLYLDLIGLPPTPAQVDAFLKDPSPEAYRNTVETLLASPHYGERWGRLWLDAARYADSDGFEKDKPRFVTFYRDWVIRAHNQDLPYNQFILEQIAGDLLPRPTQDQIVATGFLRNSMINEEGGVDPEQFRMEAMFDRLDTIGKSILGLTIGCAQCHTHKYDPIPHVEYYQLFALLNTAHEASTTVYTVPQAQKRAELFQAMQALREEFKHHTPDWAERLSVWERQLPAPPAWQIVRPALDGSGGQKHTLLPDGSILAGGYAPTKHTTYFTVTLDQPTTIRAIRLELLTDPTLPHGGPGRSVDGTVALTEFHVDALGQRVKLARATANANAPEQPLPAAYDDRSNRKRRLGPASWAIDGNDETAWSQDQGPGRRNQPCEIVFECAEPIQLAAGQTVTFSLVQNHGGWNSDDNQTLNLGHFRFSLTAAPNAQADPLPAAARAVLAMAASSRRPADVDTLLMAWWPMDPQWATYQERLEALWKQHPAGQSQLVLQEMATGRPTYRLKRGDFTKPAEEVTPAVPQFLNPFPADAPKNRLGLARWLVAEDAPTTARAQVNRVWQAYFGRGLIETPEDLGTQGAPASHPELLDWLAVEFMKPTLTSGNPWSLKALHRLIVSSATYQQSSQVTREALQADPGNIWLARAPRFRLEGELVRDSVLQAAGLLQTEVGGGTVYPPIPMFLMQPPASYGPKSWPETTGPQRFRRSVYVFRFRSVPYPPLQTFDTPNGDTACVKRTRSNTPLQALVGLNEPLFQDAARGLANRMLTEAPGTTDRERLRFGFRCCVAREPRAAELDSLEAFLKQQRTRFQQDLAAAEQLRGSTVDLPKNQPPAEVAPWVAVGRVLLNLDETLTRE